MQNIFYKTLVTLLLSSLLNACSSDRGRDPTEETPAPSDGNRVAIPPNVRRNLGITFVKVERRQVQQTLRIPGRFELHPLASRTYRTILSGTVELAVEPLDSVQPGTLLYRLHASGWNDLQSQIALTQASYDQATSDLEILERRVKGLQQAQFKRADLEMELDRLKANVDKRSSERLAVLERAATVLNLLQSSSEKRWLPEALITMVDDEGVSRPFYQTLDHLEIRASQSGKVAALLVTDGAYVEEGGEVLQTLNPGQLQFKATGLQSDLSSYQFDLPAHIVPVQAKGMNLSTSIEATWRLGIMGDPVQRSIPIIAKPGRLEPWMKPGVAAFLELTTDSSDGAVLAIPRKSVVRDGTVDVFFKRDPFDPNKAIRVEADLGVNDGRWIEIRSDLGPNDEVVIDGAYELKLATASNGKPQAGGHFHADGTYHGEH